MKKLTAILAAAGLGLAALQSFGQAPAAPAAGSFEALANDLKNPASWLNWGADFRVRNEYYNNIVTLDSNALRHEQDVIRYRARLWTTIKPVAGLSFNARLAAEPRQWLNPSFVGSFAGRKGLEWRYALLDNLNVKWEKMFELPMTLTVGRQDIMIGDPLDWWLVLDATPNDGSFTNYLDAARLSYEAQDIQTQFDLIYIHHNAIAKDLVPTIGSSKNYPLTDQNERGLILYASNKSIEKTQLDGYFIYKHDLRETFPVLGRPYTRGDEAEIYTVGSKLTGSAGENWKYSVEAAYQFGHKDDRISGIFAQRDISAFGTKGKLTFDLKDGMKNQFALEGEYLSGDAPSSTDKDEMFDLLWGRWPRWSELYIYSYVNEAGGRIAQINNILHFGPTWSCVPFEGNTFSLGYQGLWAPEDVPTRALTPGLYSNKGNFRGHFVKAVMKHKFNKWLQGHLWAEFVWQDDYYRNRDLLSFIRAEIMVTF